MSKLIIQQVAAQKGMNQSRLQMEAKVTSQLLYRYWHNFTKSVELEQLEKIATALGVEPGELLVSERKYKAMTAQSEEPSVA